MVQQVKSRSQRRMEKKQALLVVVLLLVASLASFSLGVIVGKSRPDEVSIAPSPAIPSYPVEPVASSPKPSDKVAESPGQERTEKNPQLTFYDALPKGAQPPLGSGINLPPAEKPSPVVKEAPVQQQPVVKEILESLPEKKVEPVKKAAVQAPLPKADSKGAYVVQVASFKQQKDARGLRDRLVKTYPAFTESADLGEKGVWHRVLVGPFTNTDVAKTVMEHLKAEEKISGIVKRR